MKNIGEVIKEGYYLNKNKLESDYKFAEKNNPTFKKIITKLKLPDTYLMKYTTKIEESAKELDNCKKCKGLNYCKNYYNGYIFYPEILNDNLVFDYIPCKYKKEQIENNKDRFEIIKWLKNFLDTYEKGKSIKGLYLTGNFGCGKTYLVSACLNELAKKNHKIAIIYYPEFLRSLKESFNYPEEYNQKFKFIKNVELLLIDDIGAETMTEWSRDEVLGTILQYRMQEGLTTFFTSNYTIKELEEHFSISSKGIEKVKAKRIIERINFLTKEMVMVSANKREREE